MPCQTLLGTYALHSDFCPPPCPVWIRSVVLRLWLCSCRLSGDACPARRTRAERGPPDPSMVAGGRSSFARPDAALHGVYCIQMSDHRIESAARRAGHCTHGTAVSYGRAIYSSNVASYLQVMLSTRTRVHPARLPACSNEQRRSESLISCLALDASARTSSSGTLLSCPPLDE